MICEVFKMEGVEKRDGAVAARNQIERLHPWKTRATLTQDAAGFVKSNRQKEKNRSRRIGL
jgi:hypothetical protein